MANNGKKDLCYGLESLRPPIPFHGGGATIEDDYITLPACSWIHLSLYIFEPIEQFENTLYRLINSLPTDKIYYDTFKKNVDEAVDITTKEIVECIHGIGLTFERYEKYDLFRCWYEAYLTALFLTVLCDFKLELQELTDPGYGKKPLFYDNMCNSVYPHKDYVLEQVKIFCIHFKKTYQILNVKNGT